MNEGNSGILETKDLTRSFGDLVAVDTFNLTLNEHEFLGLIGPNGAGKTTFFNTVTGFLKADHGKVYFNDEDITNLPPHKIVRKGIARTWQIPRPLTNLTVLENVMTAAFLRKSSRGTARASAIEIIEELGLDERAHTEAGTLNPVERKKLALSRALATDPEILLIDEVVAGLNPTEVDRILELLQKIHKEFNLSTIMVEHVMRAVMNIAERIVVIHFGEKLAEGTPEEISNNEKVIKAYLGERWE